MRRLVFIVFSVAPFHVARADAMNYTAVSEVNSGRVGGALVRYIKTFEDECLEIEVLSEKSKWDVLSSMHLCSFEGKPFSTGFADAGFKNITFEKDGIHLTLSITPLEPLGEKIKECVIPIANGYMSSLQCYAAPELESQSDSEW